MTQRTIDVLFKQNLLQRPKKNYITNKTDVYLFDDTWSLDCSGLNDYSPENKRSYTYVLVVSDKFSEFSWTVLSKNENAQTKTNFRKHSHFIQMKINFS